VVFLSGFYAAIASNGATFNGSVDCWGYMLRKGPFLKQVFE
jgi:hypothetical protein